jgi:hypothetical protein
MSPSELEMCGEWLRTFEIECRERDKGLHQDCTSGGIVENENGKGRRSLQIRSENKADYWRLLLSSKMKKTTTLNGPEGRRKEKAAARLSAGTN